MRDFYFSYSYALHTICRYAGKTAKYWAIFDDSQGFYEVFSLFFIHIDKLWTQKQAVRAQFGAIIGETKTLMQNVLLRQPNSLESFRRFAQAEGLLS